MTDLHINLLEIKQDVKDIKQLLQGDALSIVVMKKDIALHKKLWSGLIGIIVSIIITVGAVVTQKQL